MERRDYRNFVGLNDNYDTMGALQFNFLTSLGLREYHYLLDIGCGSLRAGRLLIPYLLPGRYFGIEPQKWLIDDAIRNELGEDLVRIKRPVFSNDSNLMLTTFGQKFDYLIAHSVFVHAPKHAIERCMSEAKKVMKPDSIFVATILLGNVDNEENEWSYPTSKRTVEYRESTIRRIVEEQGLILKKLGKKQGSKQTWIRILKKENKT